MTHGEPLSEILDAIAVRSAVSGAFVQSGRWRTESSIDVDLKFIAVLHGNARLETDGVRGAIDLDPGDIAMLNGRTRLRLDGGRGEEAPRLVPPPEATTPLPNDDRIGDADAVIGGRIDLDPIGRDLLLRILPPVLHARAGAPAGHRLRDHLQRIFEELAARRPGAEFAVRQHAQLLVLEILRSFADDTDLPAGWLGVISDESLRPALESLHAEPARSWRLDELAGLASMPRTTFAERFRAAAGTTPLAYLHDWRMLNAQRALRSSDVPIGALARETGYLSESAFSTAFTKHVGASPRAYRKESRLSA
ncbi:AraC family transcriptional regulator [Brachybacterium endophyticum]|uniref:AraC family transcriptional regulator n=1 Tax=Brachybacterium endophyticum TaxID=2182385 RepID=A0A2U2RHJ9_9MICO|nr:AraC family transcriptional regulator [Brachybacterium endophyticum]PWH05301.1 AraC family transcriptional regulator [Brachybacterium endophyticum]